MKLLLLSAFCISAFCAWPKTLPEMQTPSETLKKFKGTNNDELRKQFEEYLEQKNFVVSKKAGK